MSKYQFTTIKKAVTEVAENHYLLPAIQRKFVWNSEQIERLFDSILRNYPINSFHIIKDYVQWYNENQIFREIIFPEKPKMSSRKLDILTSDEPLKFPEM